MRPSSASAPPLTMAAGRARGETFAAVRIRQSAADPGCVATYPECGMQTVPEQAVVRDLTFLFADVEGSTRLAELHGSIAATAVIRYHELVAEAAERHGGTDLRAHR